MSAAIVERFCTRWCADRGNPHDVCFRHVGSIGDPDDPRKLDVSASQQREDPIKGYERPRIEVWHAGEGLLLTPAQARSLARWLTAAADLAEGSVVIR